MHKVYIKQRSIIPFVDIGRIIDHLRLNFLFMKHFNITRPLFLPVELKPYCINTNAEEYSMLAINKIILIICVVCCRPLSYVPNVTSVSGLSTLDYSYSLLSRLYTIIILVFFDSWKFSFQYQYIFSSFQENATKKLRITFTVYKWVCKQSGVLSELPWAI